MLSGSVVTKILRCWGEGGVKSVQYKNSSSNDKSSVEKANAKAVIIAATKSIGATLD